MWPGSQDLNLQILQECILYTVLGIKMTSKSLFSVIVDLHVSHLALIRACLTPVKANKNQSKQ